MHPQIFVPRYPRRVGLRWDFEHRSPEGDLLWEDRDVHNELTDEGEQSILDVYFRNGTAVATFYGRLYNDTPVDTDTLATLTGEVTGTGYDPSTQAVWARNSTDWPTLALDSGDYRVSGLQRSYVAGGAWTAATVLVLASVATGTAGLHLAWVSLSTTRTLALNDTLNVTPRVKLA